MDPGFDPSANDRLFAMAVQADGKIVIGGTFNTVGGVTRNRIARLNADGTLDTAFDPNASGALFTTALQPDGKIVIGGTFTIVGGVARYYIARLNADARRIHEPLKFGFVAVTAATARRAWSADMRAMKSVVVL